jgi:hypothetical protein
MMTKTWAKGSRKFANSRGLEIDINIVDLVETFANNSPPASTIAS